jgi:hypothetical protein
MELFPTQVLTQESTTKEVLVKPQSVSCVVTCEQEESSVPNSEAHVCEVTTPDVLDHNGLSGVVGA